MLFNKDTAISTSKILLVPYEPHHVPTYHTWMEDEETRIATASEPLSLDEEYAMQHTWRNDADKLTFIACLPLPPSISITNPTPTSSPTRTSILPPVHEPLHPSPTQVLSGTHDEPTRMIGDINLFLTREEASTGEGCKGEEYYAGELELMIAPPSARRQGYGRAALLAFLKYIQTHREEILHEYQSRIETRTLTGKSDGGAINGDINEENPENEPQNTIISNGDADPSSLNGSPNLVEGNGHPLQKPSLFRLKAKISATNKGSIHLFRSTGFSPVDDCVPNFFGEVELIWDRFPDREGGESREDTMKGCDDGIYEELEYCRG